MIIGLLLLILFNTLGTWTVQSLKLVVPGPVVGLLYLFVALCLFPKMEKYFLRLTGFISRHLALFFIPAGVGIIQYGGLIQNQGGKLFFILCLSLILTLLISAWLFQYFLRKFHQGDFRE